MEKKVREGERKRETKIETKRERKRERGGGEREKDT